MAYDKVVDSAALDAAMTHTANRIRNKTGGTDQITWDSAKGFGDAVDAITSGSSAPESDPPMADVGKNMTETSSSINIAADIRFLIRFSLLYQHHKPHQGIQNCPENHASRCNIFPESTFIRRKIAHHPTGLPVHGKCIFFAIPCGIEHPHRIQHVGISCI